MRVNNMLGKAYLNGALLTTLYIPTNFTSKTKVYHFKADREQNVLCFNETHSAAPPFAYSQGIGAQIDNVSLILVNYYILFSFALS